MTYEEFERLLIETTLKARATSMMSSDPQGFARTERRRNGQLAKSIAWDLIFIMSALQRLGLLAEEWMNAVNIESARSAVGLLPEE